MTFDHELEKASMLVSLTKRLIRFSNSSWVRNKITAIAKTK